MRSENGSSTRIGTQSMIPRWFGSSASAFTRKTPSETKLPPCTPVACPKTLMPPTPPCPWVSGPITVLSRFTPRADLGEQLQHAVDRVQRDAAAEGADGDQVEALAAAHDVRDPRDQEDEVDGVLRHALRVLVERVARAEVEEAEQEHHLEPEQHQQQRRRAARQRPVAPHEPVEAEDEQEEQREDVLERDLPRERPVDLGPGRDDERRRAGARRACGYGSAGVTRGIVP